MPVLAGDVAEQFTIALEDEGPKQKALFIF